jgi:hypothetical protein
VDAVTDRVPVLLLKIAPPVPLLAVVLQFENEHSSNKRTEVAGLLRKETAPPGLVDVTPCHVQFLKK